MYHNQQKSQLKKDKKVFYVYENKNEGAAIDKNATSNYVNSKNWQAVKIAKPSMNERISSQNVKVNGF